ncbi:hypothetical protein [Pedobacter metabolipauper]|uniref:Uncharacterized protein n=1 Tax=Pedobacter metabolipauper TaxID=425513 RepID=A0A4R6SZ95_9SPHI|nr:hypothetical protein [Pedobacter metabolipauper]TDQ11776.1 hypothetical protein ATK78_0904 [Pedobacter metabolipauper]
MSKIEEPWEPFNIELSIEGKPERLLVIPDREEPKYELFDQHTSIGTVWTETGKQGRFWCGEGLIVKELLDLIGEQIDTYTENKPI